MYPDVMTRLSVFVFVHNYTITYNHNYTITLATAFPFLLFASRCIHPDVMPRLFVRYSHPIALLQLLLFKLSEKHQQKRYKTDRTGTESGRNRGRIGTELGQNRMKAFLLIKEGNKFFVYDTALFSFKRKY